jgi:hypothetical protein
VSVQGLPLKHCGRKSTRAARRTKINRLSEGDAGTGLHWNALDEDISVEGLLMGIGDQTQDHSLAA